MKIVRMEAYVLQDPGPSKEHWVSHFKVPHANEILVKLFTDDGIEGFGLATSYTSNEPMVKVLKDGLAELVIGEDPLAPEQVYHKVFSLTWKRLAAEKAWTREALVRLSAAIDIACWDIIGKATRFPLFRLLGGWRSDVPYYVTCAYYQEGKGLPELRDEMHQLLEQGHTRFKAKVGGLSLEEDIERLETIREVIGFERDMMVDVNRAWDLRTATRAVRLMEPLRPRWLEEPLRWTDDRHETTRLAQRTHIPITGGESEMTVEGCRAFIDERAISVLQFDVTMMGGVSGGRKLSALCELNHVDVAPHHDAFIHAHIVAGSPAGLIVESFPDPSRDPLQAELFENPPVMRDGQLFLNEDPGLGLTLSERAIDKFGTRIV
ncbi:mandelate racemase/muconate lactonizing enzyme family protein [Paraburkholderia sp. 22B1P]|uniref:mandelate racemase/muconate lactonizing enzyme family protein n=1 Tax=Paraburkholderia sp. 22B1P TaxID=3080498 RepID=UPI003085667E|nr:mandelate racemase/muconate lactonizing enzyme family protein [Paraburkholderia sp. 22B1P]